MRMRMTQVTSELEGAQEQVREKEEVLGRREGELVSAQVTDSIIVSNSPSSLLLHLLIQQHSIPIIFSFLSVPFPPHPLLLPARVP